MSLKLLEKLTITLCYVTKPVVTSAYDDFPVRTQIFPKLEPSDPNSHFQMKENWSESLGTTEPSGS